MIHAAESCISLHGLENAELTVEEHNDRARTLYERLGHHPVGEVVDVTPYHRPDGVLMHAASGARKLLRFADW